MDKATFFPGDVSEVAAMITESIMRQLPKPQAPEVSILTEKELAKFLKVSIPTIQKLRKGGKIPFFMLESSVRYNQNEVVKALEDEREQRGRAA